MVQVKDGVDVVEDAEAVLQPAWTSIEIILVSLLLYQFPTQIASP